MYSLFRRPFTVTTFSVRTAPRSAIERFQKGNLNFYFFFLRMQWKIDYNYSEHSFTTQTYNYKSLQIHIVNFINLTAIYCYILLKIDA